MLPTEPLSMSIGYWWIVEPIPMTQQDFLKLYPDLSDEEKITMAIIKKEGKVLACKVPHDGLDSVYKRGLVHFHVPIDDQDYIILPPLKHFIMNRQPDSHFEKLLYDVLVTIDERTSVSDLATLLEGSLDIIRHAVSICCRLDFAKKKMKKPQNMSVRLLY